MQWCKAAEDLTLARGLPDGIVEWALEHITDGLFVDGGAHVGMFCIPVLLARPEARCVAFEPNPITRAALQEIATVNGVTDRLIVHQTALWDHESMQALKVPKVTQQCGLATLGLPRRFSGHRAEMVQTRILDHYKLTPQLIKLDLEGAELHALAGAMGTIILNRPAIVTEAYAPNTAQFGYEPNEIKSFLEELGYTCHVGREDLFCTI